MDFISFSGIISQDIISNVISNRTLKISLYDKQGIYSCHSNFSWIKDKCHIIVLTTNAENS